MRFVISSAVLMLALPVIAVAQSGAVRSAPPPDVFSSGSGAPDDPRRYVSPDGRFLDRCAYDTARMPNLPDTKMYGMPDHVPIDAEVMRQYARCAVDACAVNQRAVCWGKRTQNNPALPPTSADSFNTNGYSNCRQQDANTVVCDPPRTPEALPAPCLSGTLICEEKRVFKFYAKTYSSGTDSTSYNQNYGKKLPAMTGRTVVNGTTVYVDTPAGFAVGQGLSGPVQVRSAPPRFSTATGYIDPANTRMFIMTDLRDLSGRAVLTNGETIRVPLTQRR